MPYKDGTWGEQAKERQIRRRANGYFRNYRSNMPKKSIGYFGEIESISILNGSIRLPHRSECDLLWNNKKIEVKTALKKFYKNLEGWKFDIENQKDKCDYFLLLCKNADKITKYIFMIPSNAIKPKTGIWINLKKINNYLQWRII